MKREWLTKGKGLLVAASLLAGLLAGCGGNEGGTGGGSGDGSSSGGSGDEQIKLRVVESLTSPNRTALIQKMLDDFQAENPNIKVELISPPFDQADNKIRQMLSAKEDVDVLEVRDLTVAEFVNNGYIEPLDSFTSGWSEFDTLSNVSKSVGMIKDKLYFIPNGLYQRQLFYRKDWLDEKGLKVPTTYEELYEIGKQLTDPANNRFGFSFRGGPGSQGVTDAMVLAYNGDKVNLEDAQFLKDGSTIYSSPEAKQAMELYLKIYKETSPPDSINWGFQEQVQAFTSGVTAFLLQDPDVIQVLTEKMEEGTWATAPMPLGPSGKALIAAGGAGWGIAAHSEHKEAAWKLIEFLSSEPRNTQFSKDFGMVPIHSTAAEDEYFQSGPYKTLLEMTDKPDIFLNYKPPYQYPGMGQWSQVSMESQQAMLMNAKTIDEMLADWSAYWEEEKAKMNK